jgi:hypothetical protein
MTQKKIRVVVFHDSYGCETGCCGHVVEATDGSWQKFDFDHPYTDDADAQRVWAVDFAQAEVVRHFGEGHVADLDWDNCIISDY